MCVVCALVCVYVIFLWINNNLLCFVIETGDVVMTRRLVIQRFTEETQRAAFDKIFDKHRLPQSSARRGRQSVPYVKVQDQPPLAS